MIVFGGAPTWSVPVPKDSNLLIWSKLISCCRGRLGAKGGSCEQQCQNRDGGEQLLKPSPRIAQLVLANNLAARRVYRTKLLTPRAEYWLISVAAIRSLLHNGQALAYVYFPGNRSCELSTDRNLSAPVAVALGPEDHHLRPNTPPSKPQ